MEIAAFVEGRRPRWQELEALLTKADGTGLSSLQLEEARNLSRLYRAASSDLLQVRAHGGASEVAAYLNDLVARAYALTYPGRSARFSEVWRFLARGFPDVLARHWRPVAAAALIFLAGSAFGWLGMAFDPKAAPYLVPEQHLKTDPLERAKEEANREVADVENQAAFTSFLFTNNIQVAFLAFALGLTAGVGTAIVLFFNGIFLGSLAWVYASKGMAGWFWAWILPHGIPELTAIFIGGGAGFVVARALVAPGGLSRRAALRKEAPDALRLVLGTLTIFVLAGFIEGTISQIHPPKLSVGFKVSFALAVGTGVYAYLLSGIRRARRAEDAARLQA